MSGVISVDFNIELRDKLAIELSDLKNMLYFKNEEIKQLKNLIEKKETVMTALKTEIINNCNHEWENDFIDSMEGYKLSIPIRYCIKCELNDATHS